MQNENVSCYFATGLGISCLHKFCISLMKPPNSSEIPGKIRPCLNFSFKSYGFLYNPFIVFSVSYLYFAFPRSHWFHYSLCGGSTKVCFAPVLPFDDDGRLLQTYNQTASRYFDILVFWYFCILYLIMMAAYCIPATNQWARYFLSCCISYFVLSNQHLTNEDIFGYFFVFLSFLFVQSPLNKAQYDFLIDL